MTDHAELIERLRAEASGMTNLSQSAWGIAEPVMLGEKLDFDKALHGFFMAVYEYCDGTASAHRQAATALSALVAERDALREALKPFAEWWQRALEQSASKNQPITSVEMTWGLRDDYGNYPDEWPEAFRRAALAQGGEKP